MHISPGHNTQLHACPQWERLKRAGMAPGPRASFGMAAHRTRAILFGGITDQRGKVGLG